MKQVYGPKKLECYIAQVKLRLAKDKTSSLMGPFISYEEKNVVNTVLGGKKSFKIANGTAHLKKM
jgi:hypothetical protein